MQLGVEVFDPLRIARILGEVLRLPGVSLEVEQLHLVDVRVANQLVPLGANHALEVAIRSVDRIVEFLFPARQKRDQAGELHRFGRFNAGHLAGGGEGALQVDHRVDLSARLNARAAEDIRHADRMIVLVLLAHQSVLSDSQAVVGREDDDGVVGLAASFQGVEDAAEVVVRVRDDRVIFAAMHLHRLLRARERRQPLIAQLVVALVERMLGHVIRRDLDILGRVHIDVFFRRLPRIMWSVERHVHKEWIVTLRDVVLQVLDGGVGPELAAVDDLAVDVAPVTGERFVRGAPRVTGPGRSYGSLTMPFFLFSSALVSLDGNMPPPVGPIVLKLRLRALSLLCHLPVMKVS